MKVLKALLAVFTTLAVALTAATTDHPSHHRRCGQQQDEPEPLLYEGHSAC